MEVPEVFRNSCRDKQEDVHRTMPCVSGCGKHQRAVHSRRFGDNHQCRGAQQNSPGNAANPKLKSVAITKILWFTQHEGRDFEHIFREVGALLSLMMNALHMVYGWGQGGTCWCHAFFHERRFSFWVCLAIRMIISYKKLCDDCWKHALVCGNEGDVLTKS